MNRAPVIAPNIETPRLVLRPFDLNDAPIVQRLAGDRAVADTTLHIPHPYVDGMAESWIGGHGPEQEAGSALTLAVVLRADEDLIGAIGLKLVRELDKGELGYWIGKPFWNSGYATEAAAAVVEFGFVELGLNRISATHLARNPASGRVMQKIGMQLEGTARQDTIKWGIYEDLVHYAILRDDFSHP